MDQLDSLGACNLPGGAAYTTLRPALQGPVLEQAGVAAAMEAPPGAGGGTLTHSQPDWWNKQ